MYYVYLADPVLCKEMGIWQNIIFIILHLLQKDLTIIITV